MLLLFLLNLNGGVKVSFKHSDSGSGGNYSNTIEEKSYKNENEDYSFRLKNVATDEANLISIFKAFLECP